MTKREWYTITLTCDGMIGVPIVKVKSIGLANLIIEALRKNPYKDGQKYYLSIKEIKEVL